METRELQVIAIESGIKRNIYPTNFSEHFGYFEATLHRLLARTATGTRVLSYCRQQNHDLFIFSNDNFVFIFSFSRK